MWHMVSRMLIVSSEAVSSENQCMTLLLGCYELVICWLLVADDVVGQALLATLEKGLGKEWTESVKSAWTDVYGTVASTMKAGAAEAPPPPPASPQLPTIRPASSKAKATPPTPEKVAAQAATLQSSWGMFVAKSAGWGSGQKHFDGAAVAVFKGM